MLRILGLLFLLTNTAWATTEPEKLFVVSGGKVREIHFRNFKPVEITTTNHHPKFVDKGKIKFKGFLVRDILSSLKIGENQAITLVGRTGQFAIEITGKELLGGDNIIATHIDGKSVDTTENGLQIIYDEKTIAKFPHLKQRNYWLWWVRSFILDNKFHPKANVSLHFNDTLKSEFPWPSPYGRSSLGESQASPKRKWTKISAFKKVNVETLNGNKFEINPIAGTQLVLGNSGSNPAGAYSLHQLIEKNGSVGNFVDNIYFIKSLEVIR